jgi:hypothetical protein
MLIMTLDLFLLYSNAGAGEVDSATGLCIATDAMKKKLDGLLITGHQACSSLHIAGSSTLSAIGLTKKLLLVPRLVVDWKQFFSSGWCQNCTYIGKGPLS